MHVTARWHARYAAASAQLRSTTDVLAVRAAVEDAGRSGAERLRWLIETPALPAHASVGVLAGSFNPLTRAHTTLMRRATRTLRLSAVVWACSQTTVAKERVERATLVDRLVQMEAYLRARPGPVGLALLGAGLYADQAMVLRVALPPSARLWLIVGEDKIFQIFDARYYDDRDTALRQLFHAAKLAVVPRGTQHGAGLADLLAVPANRPYARDVRLLPAQPELADLSSTAARALAARGATPPHLAGMLEPEGAALAHITGAYGPPTVTPSGEAFDPYALRQALITCLARRQKHSRADVLGRLLDRASAPTPDGERMRERLQRQMGPG